ncbi:MAG TPA: phosphoenolpyruvate synthase [Candidatus Poseidoniaceae archaeon]|nr:phosphoenolpyruvate synthase [Candidatus Poseidoniaceae archaeon]|tara:strand:+ start:3045 stop:5690 length:2646 start_codon:yes stop_codon:yes gene_type:complete
MPDAKLAEWFANANMNDTATVGGKGASLGEMFQKLSKIGVKVPNGFTLTTAAFKQFVEAEIPATTWNNIGAPEDIENLRNAAINCSTLASALEVCLRDANPKDHLNLNSRASLARSLVRETPVPDEIKLVIGQEYSKLCELYHPGVDVAVRSSATTEDSAEASFAGQYESYLNVSGEQDIIEKWRRCVASMFTERAIGYHIEHGMHPLDSAIAVVVMKMARSDKACSGVMFTIDPDSGHDGVIHIGSSYGLGELVVQGVVSPDTYTVWKEGLRQDKFPIVHRTLGSKEQMMIYHEEAANEVQSIAVPYEDRRRWSLSRGECIELAQMALKIEDYFAKPMDIEWAKDGVTNDLFIVQARPETIHSKAESNKMTIYKIDEIVADSLKKKGRVLATGQAVGKRIGTGNVRLYRTYGEVLEGKRELRKLLESGMSMEEISSELSVFEEGDVLVTEMTTPDWEPLMKQASLIITRKGGRTSHAAIIAREFGIPAIVGCSNAMDLPNFATVTGSCAEGDTGYVYSGEVPFEIEEVSFDEDVELTTKIKLNVGFPTKSLTDSKLPVDGVGLARIEFILSSELGIHPLAFVHHDDLKHYVETGELSPDLKPYHESFDESDISDVRSLVESLESRAWAYEDKRGLFIDKLREGVGLICAAFYPRPVLVRLSDFKSNEYRELLGGSIFEPVEENPMIAWRGASRYLDEKFKPAFEMEIAAMKSVKYDFGLDNLQLMVPFCRTPEEGKMVKDLLEQNDIGPSSGTDLFVMVELPSNAIEADRFMDMMALSGGSIGSNDLVQTVYAVSRDDLEGYQNPVDARSPAVKSMIRDIVRKFRARNLEIGICGQAPSDFPDEFPPFLIDCGITSISVTPDTAIAVRATVAEAEKAARS